MRRILIMVMVVALLAWAPGATAGTEIAETCFGLEPTITGTAAGETINGTPGDDVIVGRGGDDTINGRGGDDKLCGGKGNDRLNGGLGDDELDGEAGADIVIGHVGHDSIHGGDGNDRLYDGGGNDSVYGDAGNDRFITQPGTNWIHGGDDNDMFVMKAGTNTVNGGDGEDWINFLRSREGLTIDLDDYPGVEHARGTKYPDVMEGTWGDNRLYGHGGGDTIRGSGGDDTLYGGNGNDDINGGSGDDTIWGDAGRDMLDGSSGTDTINGGADFDTCYGEAIAACERPTRQKFESGSVHRYISHTQFPTHVITVNQSGTIQDLDLSVKITHTHVGDLVVILTHLDTNTNVAVIHRPGTVNSYFGCSGNNIDATVDDEAAQWVETMCRSGTPTISGRVSPNSPLDRFDGEDIRGRWQIEVKDYATLDHGYLESWSLEPLA